MPVITLNHNKSCIVFNTRNKEVIEINDFEQQIKEQKHQEDLQRLRGFRPIDDTFMRGMFKDNLPLAQLVLRIVTGKKDLILTEFKTQADMVRVTGSRSICLDVYGTDSSGAKYDLEVQRADHGANPYRARYHSSVLDIENLHKGQDFTELPNTYIIFIIEKDFYGEKAPVYTIQNMNLITGEPFNDGTYILYVNGEYRGNDELGRLMHDFNCTRADDMTFDLMAEKTRYLKENPEGAKYMCKVMEDLRDDVLLETIRNLMKNLKITAEQAMLAMGLSDSDRKKYIKML